MPVKVFTAEEANRLLPQVESGIRTLQEMVANIVQGQDSLSVLELLNAGEPDNPEHEEFLRRGLELEERVLAYNERLERLQDLGCVLKDLNHGIVDFYGSKDGRLIFLCWRLGESSVGFWHEINDGMVGRRPVSEL